MTYQRNDIIKFIAWMFVVAIHTGLFASLPKIEKNFIYVFVLRLAVPFFFCSTGYYLYEKVKKSNNINMVYLSFIKRLLPSYIVFLVIWILQLVLYYIIKNRLSVNIIYELILRVIFYPGGALWYVWGCFVAALLMYFPLKYNYIYIIIIVGLLFHSLLIYEHEFYCYFELKDVSEFIMKFKRLFYSLENGFTVGLIYMGLGVLCSKIRKKYFSDGVLLYLIAFFFLALALEWKIILSLNQSYYCLTYIFLVPLIFLFSVNLSTNNQKTIYLRNLSTGIYFLHRPILFFIEIMVKSFVIKFVITFLISLMICMIIYRKKKDPYYSLLK